jgi:hypothetical protein
MEFTAWPKSAESSGRLFGCTVCTALFALTTVICLVFVGVVLLRNTTAIDTIARVRTPTAAAKSMALVAPAVPTVVPLRVASRQSKTARGGGGIARVVCPNTGVVLSVMTMQPDGECAIPAIMEIGTTRLVCAFESRAPGGIMRHIYTPIPQTKCTNSECACVTAADTWPTIAIYGQGQVKVAAAYTLAEDATDGTTFVLFELATTTAVSDIATAKRSDLQSHGPGDGGDDNDDQAAYLPLCHLIITPI